MGATKAAAPPLHYRTVDYRFRGLICLFHTVTPFREATEKPRQKFRRGPLTQLGCDGYDEPYERLTDPVEQTPALLTLGSSVV